MKRLNITLLLFLSIISSHFAQTEDTLSKEEFLNSAVITKIDQSNIKRVMTEKNEAALYKATKRLIKLDNFQDFTVLTGWYKQTRTHYYYQIGWMVNGQPMLQFIKYRWADGAVSSTTQEEIDADTDTVTSAEVTKN